MLTEEQGLAVEEPNEYKLICALAGSGKTFTFISLAEEILKLNQSHRVLMVTFTNAAANEMDERLAKRLAQKDYKRTSSSTFASLMMRQFRPLVKKRRCIIGAEQYSFVKRAIIAEGGDSDELEFFMSSVDQFGRELDGEFQDNTYSFERKVYARYCKILSDQNCYDLNMMARELIAGLQSGVIKPYNFTHLLCDEYQDTDNLQYLWLKIHGDAGLILACVGDDDQSIYSWRGALSFDAFKRLQKDFNASGYLLSKSFRCASNILSSAKKFIENNQDRLPKEMVSGIAEQGQVYKVEIPINYISQYQIDNEMRDKVEVKSTSIEQLSSAEKEKQERYRFVAEKINSINKPGWAVLARTNRQLDQMEKALLELQLKVVRIGGKSIFDNIHAVSMVNLFYGLVNDSASSELVSGLGWAGEKEENLKYISQVSSAMGFAAASQIGDVQWTTITAYMQEMSLLAKQCRESDSERYIQKWGEVMLRVIRKLGDKERKFQVTILEIILNILRGSKGDLYSRARNLVDKTRKPKNKIDHKQEDAIILSTMNSSKGLEWPRVWLIDIEDGIVPMLKENVTIEAIEEERRLVYVAMTRAQFELYLSYKEGNESMFIEEIDGVLGGV